MILLAAAALLSGAVSAWVFIRVGNMAAMRKTLRKIHGHFLEFRLFFDEPALIWRAQKELFQENITLCWMLLRPTAILILPFTWLMLQYGWSPLRVGEPALVTAQFNTDLNDNDSSSELKAPPGVEVETEPVRVLTDRQMVWRIRPTRDVTGDLHFLLRGVTMSKAVTTNGFAMPRKGSGWLDFLIHPEEGRLPAGPVAWLQVDYPKQSPLWIAWFFVISSVSALLFARWF